MKKFGKEVENGTKYKFREAKKFRSLKAMVLNEWEKATKVKEKIVIKTFHASKKLLPE